MMASAALSETTTARLARHWRALFALTWPVVLSRAGLVLMAMADVVMVGRYDTGALAALSLGYAVVMPLLVTGIGCMVGVIATTAYGMGAGSPDTPAIGLRGLHWAVVIGGVAGLLSFVAGPVLRLIGQAPELATGGAAVALMFAPGTLLQIVFVAASFYLEGTGRPRPSLVAMIGANVLNVGLNWLMIGGRLGVPEMGAEGAALATSLARLAMVAGLLVWMLRLPEFAPWRGRLSLWGPGGWRAGAEMRRIGFAGGAAYFFETVAFASLAQAAGLLGASALAAYTILHNIEALVFMIALGLSVGTAVRIGQAAGAGDRSEARFAGLAGLAAAMGLVALLGLGLFAAAPAVVGFYSADPVLIARAAPIIAILAFSMVFDAGQVVLGQSTRALGDGWGTTLCFFAAFFCVMVPLAFFLAFATPLAEAGLFIGTAVGCATAVGLLGARFLYLVARV
jgi:multidrug resistance protein, MATE family